ncbi:hypothetical protein TI39_contig340g00020 [Zymoseptoria brevis]|uniref:Uncharacterized protein n=1 Tax=Zymoseptoria brevis TaxID=1047168 RepID=A0A0F4GRT5_9PEZI|nr:hypothetical protein TI39_contig340g00020 [Zymoseptoria brevis]
MLLPVESETATANAKFDALYRDLCTNKLNPDGSTKLDVKAQKERDALADDLNKARVSVARSGLIRTHLDTLAYREEELPSELRELIATIAAALQAQLSPDDFDLLHEDMDKFKNNAQPISRLISKAAAKDLSTLAHLATTSGHDRDISLISSLKKSKDTISDSSNALSRLRGEMTQEALTAQSLYRQALEISIRILEQTVHGSLSRGTKAKADYLATVAEGMTRKLQVQQVQLTAQTASPELQAALERKMDGLEKEGLALRRKGREAQELLARYRRTEGMEEVAREFAELVREREKVRKDIERLEGGRK